MQTRPANHAQKGRRDCRRQIDVTTDQADRHFSQWLFQRNLSELRSQGRQMEWEF